MGCAMCFASCTAAPSAKHLTQQPVPNLQRHSGSWNSHLTLRPQEPSPFGRKLWFLLITVLIHIYLIFYADRNISICISVGHIFAKGDWDNNDGELVLVIQQGLQHIVKHFADFFSRLHVISSYAISTYAISTAVISTLFFSQGNFKLITDQQLSANKYH